MPDFPLTLLLILAPLTGGLLSFFTTRAFKDPLKFLLAFSGSFLFAICLSGLLPELYNQGGGKMGIWVLLGFLFQLMMEYFSKGLEHGHLHGKGHHHEQWLPVYLAMGFHAFMEGIPLGGIHFNSEDTRAGMILGIGIHELPASFALGILCQSQVKNKGLRIFYMLLYACFAMGGYSFGAFLGTWENQDWVPRGMAMVTGIFLHISTTILFENSENHRYNRIKLIFIVLGSLLGIIVSSL